MSNTFPKLHNAAWPGLVGKEEGTDNPPIPFEQMLEWTAAAEVDGEPLGQPALDPAAVDHHVLARQRVGQRLGQPRGEGVHELLARGSHRDRQHRRSPVIAPAP